MNIQGDGICFMVKTLARHKTTETEFNKVWQLVAVGGQRLVVSSSRGRMAVGS